MVTLHHITSDRQFALDIVRLKDDTEEDLVGSDAHQEDELRQLRGETGGA